MSTLAKTHVKQAQSALPARRDHLASILIVIDVIASLLALGTLRHGGTASLPDVWFERVRFSDLGILASAVALPMILGSLGGYDAARRTFSAKIALFARLAVVTPFAAWIAAISSGSSSLSTSRLVAVCLVLPAALWLVRLLLVRQPTSRAVVIGTGKMGQKIVELARRHPEHGVEILGFVDDESLDIPEGAPPLLGSVADFGSIAQRLNIDRVIVAFTPKSDAEIVQMLRDCEHLQIRVQVVPRLFDLVKHGGDGFGGLALLDASRRPTTSAQATGKRAFDLVASIGLLVCFAPIMAIIAAAVKLDDRGPVFFRQVRIGRGGEPFRVWKFRTMGQDAEQRGLERIEGLAIDDAVRTLKQESSPGVTRVGNFLRRTSLDELPQLLNVVVGEMSLVGPRPLREFEVAALTSWQWLRLDVLPGITGLWQILGRSDIDWDERMDLDYRYARHWSVASDLHILAQTLPAVLRKRGAV